MINEPVQAPVKAGQEVGVLNVKMGDFPARSYKLYAGGDVTEIGFFPRMILRSKLLFSGQ